MGWRTALFKECLFYARSLRNFLPVIQARRHGGEISHLNLRNGLTIEVIPPTQIALAVFRDIWQFRTYVKDCWDFTPRTVVDIGANIGFFSLQAATLWPGAHVYAYEPAPHNFRVLKNNIRWNRLLGQIKVYNEAAAAKPGYSVLHVKEQCECHSLYNLDSGGATVDLHQVATIGLREIVDRIPGRVIDFLKVDCEGSEYDFIGAGLDVLASTVQSGIVEYHHVPGHDPIKDLLEPLHQKGFCVKAQPLPRMGLGLIAFRRKTAASP